MAKKNSPTTLEEFRSLGGKARARKLSKSRRREIAKAGAAARWNGKNGRPEREK